MCRKLGTDEFIFRLCKYNHFGYNRNNPYLILIGILISTQVQLKLYLKLILKGLSLDE